MCLYGNEDCYDETNKADFLTTCLGSITSAISLQGFELVCVCVCVGNQQEPWSFLHS